MQRRTLLGPVLGFLLVGTCSPYQDDGGNPGVGRVRAHLEDTEVVRTRLKDRFGVWPRRYFALFDGSNEAERQFVAALPLVTEYLRGQVTANGATFDIQPAELATNFISEGGYFPLHDDYTTGIDGFGALGIDTLVDNYTALKPWLHDSIRRAVESGTRTVTRTNEQGKTVHTLTDLTLEEGLYANAGMYAWSKAQAAAAVGATYRDLEDAGQFFWATVYFNAGPGTGARLLRNNGADWFTKKWTGSDDFRRHFMSARFNALWRTSTFEAIRQVIYAEAPAATADGTGTTTSPLGGDPCGEIDYYGQCSGSLLEYCADEELQQVECGGPCGWRDEDLGYDCVPAAAAGCGRVNYQGRCDGNVLEYCAVDGSSLQTVDCTTLDASCAWVDDETGYDCVPREDPSACGDVDYLGTCDGATLVYCGTGGLERVDCAAQGLACVWQDETVGYNCLAEGDSCGSVGAIGECDGNLLRYCDGGALTELDCAADGRICGWRDESTGYDCVDAAPPVEGGCADVDYYGRCDGDLLRYCNSGEVATVDCAATGATCGWESDSIGYNCLFAGSDPSCGAVTYTGECDGDLLRYCDASAIVQEVDCAATGMVCGWQDDVTGYNCLTPATPTCNTDEFTCDDGACIPSSYLCDGYDDCTGAEDEWGCTPPPACDAAEWECADGTCIPSTYLCDSYVDCPGGDDEEGCAPPACSAEQFTCGDGSCIPYAWVCDSIGDCPGGEDETGCA